LVEECILSKGERGVALAVQYSKSFRETHDVKALFLVKNYRAYQR
jgi:hypothetical protein